LNTYQFAERAMDWIGLPSRTQAMARCSNILARCSLGTVSSKNGEFPQLSVAAETPDAMINIGKIRTTLQHMGVLVDDPSELGSDATWASPRFSTACMEAAGSTGETSASSAVGYCTTGSVSRSRPQAAMAPPVQYYHDWHAGPHVGPHGGCHWSPDYGYHCGPHVGPHRGEHHNWYAVPRYRYYRYYDWPY
jgi:hypothetical protein